MSLTGIHVLPRLLQHTASKLGQNGIPDLGMHATICREPDIHLIEGFETIGGIRTTVYEEPSLYQGLLKQSDHNDAAPVQILNARCTVTMEMLNVSMMWILSHGPRPEQQHMHAGQPCDLTGWQGICQRK